MKLAYCRNWESNYTAAKRHYQQGAKEVVKKWIPSRQQHSFEFTADNHNILSFKGWDIIKPYKVIKMNQIAFFEIERLGLVFMAKNPNE